MLKTCSRVSDCLTSWTSSSSALGAEDGAAGDSGGQGMCRQLILPLTRGIKIGTIRGSEFESRVLMQRQKLHAPDVCISFSWNDRDRGGKKKLDDFIDR
jgi:hypothetical protein